MALDLVKLFIQVNGEIGGTATTTTDTDVTPTSNRYVANVAAGNVTGSTTTIPAASFSDDSGTVLTSLPTVSANEYFNVFINGVLQQEGLSTLTTTNLTINAAVLVGVPVVLEIVDTTAASTSTTDVTGLTVSTTVNT
ncbi:DUF4183 domain-containing protein [Heyndrickxia vini]|uniref:DUF4183 domain-containing protein n=1 Tax=Heyndrickxia vini TaxID=1476025 RepID=A0ABX7E414_9BACI|nr:DUF4183 domain-containing protein [Heyndrickxia vini]QQZ10024.1 DUF4183 domain-containing protein [Heyndrickxia vini]